MTLIAERTVLFADLRGSTSLYETLGNAEATSVITHTINQLASVVTAWGGRVIKTLGDGLLALFDDTFAALQATDQMQVTLEKLVSRGRERGASPGLRALRLQLALARGEVVEMSGDCYGDAVNVAARLLDHAGDNETLVTAETLASLPPQARVHFRNLDRLQLRGRVEPVQVHVLDSHRGSDVATTLFGALEREVVAEPEGIRLEWLDTQQVFSGPSMPVVLGRSPQATYCIDDSRVSRSHARIDWHGGAYQLTDLSYNGTYVRFSGGSEVVALRRSTCTLHGSGAIGLGLPPTDATAPTVRFEILHFSDTLPHQPIDL